MNNILKNIGITTCLLIVLATTYGVDKSFEDECEKSENKNKAVAKMIPVESDEDTVDVSTHFDQNKTDQTEAEPLVQEPEPEPVDVYQYTAVKGHKGLWKLEKKNPHIVSRLATERETKRHRKKHSLEESELDSTFISTNLSQRTIVTSTKRYDKKTGEFKETISDTVKAEEFMSPEMRKARNPFIKLGLIKTDQEMAAEARSKKTDFKIN